MPGEWVERSGATILGGMEYVVRTAAPVEVCWSAYLDSDNWHRFHPSYGERRWFEGRPWEPGSRLSIEIRTPVHFVVEHVITGIERLKRISWIDHAEFVTLEQFVTFQPTLSGGTLIETWADLVGSSKIRGVLAQPLFKQFTRKWYDEFAAYCDELVEAPRESQHQSQHR